jgi:biotin carboxylase
MSCNSDYSKLHIISICAGSNQIPLITEAKSLGFNVIGIDVNINAPGLQFCDIKIQESIINYKSIYKKLNDLPKKIKIVGVATRSYGDAVITAAFLAEKFKIPYISKKNLNRFYDKNLLKNVFSKLLIKSPKLSSGKFSDKFPIVIKPMQGHAKEGVVKIESFSELEKYFDKYLDKHLNESTTTNTKKKENTKEKEKKKFLIEEYISGKEIICVGLIISGKFNLIEITDKETSPPPAFVDTLHTAPSVYEYKKNEIIEIGQKLADYFKIINSPIVMEFIVDSNDELYIIEAVPEFGGEYLCDILIPLRYNYNMFNEFIKSQTGGSAELPDLNSNSSAVAIRYITGQKGILNSYNAESVSKIPGIKYFKMFTELGQKISAPNTNHDRIGVIISQANSLKNALNSIKLAEKHLSLKVK